LKNLPDDAIWWAHNSAEQTCKIGVEEGWEVIERDLGVLRRDSLCDFRRPVSAPDLGGLGGAITPTRGDRELSKPM
jgi:hypothetical protein